jgi:hypothetical protein
MITRRNLMSFPPALLVLGFILIFAAIVVLAIRSSRRYQAEKHHHITTLGFEAPSSEPSRLQTRVEDLYRRHQKGKLALENVYFRRELDQDLYIFDIYNTSGEGSELGQEVFGMISSQLALPHFSLTTIPDFDRNSLIGGLMDTLLDKVMDLAEKHLDLERVDFPDRPEYQDRFVAFGRDPYAVRELLSRSRLGSLESETLPVQIAGSGDFLTADFSVATASSNESQDLISQYHKFLEISRIFMN